MKKRVALLIAPRIQDDFGYTPAGAAMVKASIVKAGHECKIFDFNATLETEFMDRHEDLVRQRKVEQVDLVEERR